MHATCTHRAIIGTDRTTPLHITTSHARVKYTTVATITVQLNGYTCNINGYTAQLNGYTVQLNGYTTISTGP